MVVKQTGMRHGISLLEVLMSIGVLSIGLLGVSALIPVAGHQAEEGIRNVRMSAVGKRVFRELRAQEMLRPERWYTPPPSASLELCPRIQGSATYRQPAPFCMDPQITSLRPSGTPPGLGGSMFLNILQPSVKFQMRYVFPLRTNNGAISPPHFDELFVRRDDLVFDVEDGSKAGPINQILRDGTAPLKRHGTGKFSWMATIVPTETGHTTSPIYRGPYQVSVVVFDRRVQLEARRRPFRVKSIDGWGGGNMELGEFAPWGSTDFKMDDFKRGRWVLLLGAMPAQTPDGRPYYRYDLQWYRIRSLDWGDPSSASNARQPMFSLAGPDWRMTNSATGMVPANMSVYAVFVPKIVSVYTKTMRLEE